MRWLALYARSRQVPVSVLAALLAAAAVGACALAAADGGPLDPRFGVLLPGVVVAGTARGLTGQDPELDRTATLRWAPRRAAHVLLIAALGTAVLAAARAGSQGPVAVGAAFRDATGLAGLAAVGAALGEGRFAWALPLAWTAVALSVPPGDGTAGTGAGVDAPAAVDHGRDVHVPRPGLRGDRGVRAGRTAPLTGPREVFGAALRCRTGTGGHHGTARPTAAPPGHSLHSDSRLRIQFQARTGAGTVHAAS